MVSKSLESSSTLEADGEVYSAVERVFCVFVDADAGAYEGGDGDVVADVVGVF